MTASKLRILLVEDHAATANAIQRYLQQIDYVVHVAPDVKCARELAEREDFDVLVSDIRLPDGNGWDLLRDLKRDREVSGIAISGYGSEWDLEQSEDAGFAFHLVKPISPDQLTDAIESVAAER